jgi:histidinol-phosphatase (PHP family)
MDIMMNLKSIIDCHTHSSFSPDSKVSIKDGALGAVTAGIGGITFTDHIDLGHPNHKGDYYAFDETKRSKNIELVQQELNGSIKVLDGLELGFQPQIAGLAADIVKKNNFDFVICSIHVVDRIDLGNPDFYQGKTKHQSLTRYLEAIYESVKTFDDFDVIGHIGYMCRYMPYPDKSFKYADYADLLDLIFKTVIAKDKGIEINTAGFFYKLDATHPGYDSIQRYKDLGGKIITLGSDAHQAKRVGDKFDIVTRQLIAMGITEVAYFEKRKPVFVKIA